MSSVAPLFIVGVGRSGTSLLQSMLHAHPAIRSLPETMFFRRYCVGRQSQRMSGRRLREQLAGDKHFQRTGFPPASIPCDEPIAVYRWLLEETVGGRPLQYVGDKDPRMIDYLQDLKRLLPEARVVHVVRDPRDVLLSRTKARWSAGRPWWFHPLVYRSQYRNARLHGPRLFASRWCELRYESLIANPSQSLRTVCQQLDLPFDSSMLDFNRAAKELVSDDERDWKQETFRPLLSNNTGKWRSDLTPMQVQFCESICRETFDDHGYELSSPPSNSRWRDALLRVGIPGMGAASHVAYQACRACSR